MKSNIEYPIISMAWEPMIMSNGDLLFNNIYGKHARIVNVSNELKEIIDQFDGTRTIDDITIELQRNGHTVTSQEIQKVIGKLNSVGIISNNYKKNLPEWLTPELYERYHTLIAWFDRYNSEESLSLDMFKKLRKSKVGVIGLGGTGSLITMMLAASGIGKIVLIDGDKVELSNLVRQIFYNEEDINKYKVEVMKKRLNQFFSDLIVETIPKYIESAQEVTHMIKGLDFIFLEADAPRIMLNRWINSVCTTEKIPYIYSFSGQVGPLYIPGQSACFTCLEKHMRIHLGNEHDEIVEILQKHRTRKYPSFISGVTLNSHFQFADAIAYLTKAYEPLSKNAIIRLQLAEQPVVIEKIHRDPNCPTCGIPS